ncbi:MAG: tyrosine--tRNA ligase [Candidatus Omnitrophica bacterium]|nr:tyrosine--tRNA ligase [Candidatus Omnitrophota bacterium]
MKRKIAEHLKIIRENAVDLISEEELVKKVTYSIKFQNPLRLKIGFDPTAKDLHLGHTVLLKKLRRLQDLGHHVYFIVGDFTAQIGDPSGRKELRPVLTIREIKDNAKTYTEQAFKILHRRKTKVIFNSSWYRNLNLSQFLPLLSSYTVARMLERDDFSQRLKENRPLSILEFIYPLIQGYDSVKIKADIEFGGTDQKFNLIVGRHIQESMGQSPQIVVTMPLLVGLDGKSKMSKSLGNYVGITEEPFQMFGKLMSISDLTMWEYFRLLTDVDIEKIKNMHPKEAKLLLAEKIVSEYHSPLVAKRTKDEFERIFSRKETPRDLPTFTVSEKKVDLVELLYNSKLVSSRNQARRLLLQKGIREKGKNIPLEDRILAIPPQGLILKVGKKKFLKVVYKGEDKDEGR